MPYHIDGNHCVRKTDTGEKLKCYKTHKEALDYLRALEANVPDANKDLIEKDSPPRTDPKEWADVPDPKESSKWNLYIGDPEHIADAITALQPGGYRGNDVKLGTSRSTVISRIRAAINGKVSDKDKKQALLDRLNKVKSVSKAYSGLLPQSEVNYTTLASTPNKACANCRWFIASGSMGDDGDGDNDCHLVSEYPEPILPTGLCDRWEAVPAPTQPTQTPIPVTIVEPEDSAEMALPTTRKGFVEMIVETVKNFMQPPAPETSEPAFSVFKGLDGKTYWLARHSGKFVDRESEIITDKAHAEYVERVQKGLVPLPELWTWHKKGTRHGQADMVWKSGGFVLALGHFDDTVEAKQAVSFYQKNAGKIKLSHMFTYPKSAKQNGVYHAYNTVEITTLPDGAEAFPYTSFEEIKPMALPNEQREWIRGVLGDDGLKRVDTADAKAVDDTKSLEANGVEHKGLDNFTGSTIPAAKDDLDALKTVQTDIETRLKAVESLPDQMKELVNTIQALTKQVNASQEAESQALAKANALEKELLELKALKPPASVSPDTLLNAREKSLLDMVMTQAKVDNSPSLIEKLVGGQPAVTTGA